MLTFDASSALTASTPQPTTLSPVPLTTLGIGHHHRTTIRCGTPQLIVYSQGASLVALDIYSLYSFPPHAFWFVPILKN